MSRHKSRSQDRNGGRGSARNVRLAEQIRKDLAMLIQREFDAAQVGFITLTEVELTVDYAHAKVYFTVMGSTPDAAAVLLNEKSGWLHSLLFKRLHIHTVPTLRFLHDDQQERGLALMRLIEEVNRPTANIAARDPDIPIPDKQP